jgi:hypothetical protein
MIDADEVRALIHCLRACQHTLNAAVSEGGRLNFDLARGCAMLALIQANALERILELEAQKKRPPHPEG